MDGTPPIPLFRGERVVASWPAHYVGAYPTGEDTSPQGASAAAPSMPERPRLVVPPPGRPGWFAAARNALVASERWAVKGQLHLTDWRLVFATEPHWSHRLDGSLSLFLERLQWPRRPLLRYSSGGLVEERSRPGRGEDEADEGPSPRRGGGADDMAFARAYGWQLAVSHQGECDRPGRLQCFRVSDGEPVRRALGRLMAQAAARPAAEREDFEHHVAESWWRAGLGLLSGPTRSSLPGPFSTSPGHESYRGQGVEPPDFGLLRARLRGVEGEGLAQLPWLFAPPSPLLPPPRAPTQIVLVKVGRPLVVDRRPRQSEARPRGDWR